MSSSLRSLELPCLATSIHHSRFSNLGFSLYSSLYIWEPILEGCKGRLRFYIAITPANQVIDGSLYDIT